MLKKWDTIPGVDEKELVSLTMKLIRIPTPNPPADYSVIAPFVKQLMAELRLEVHILEEIPGKPNIVGLWRGSGDGPTLLLDSHMDVVPAGTGWNIDPWEAVLRDGVIYGRGAADLKQTLATMICVVRSLKRAGFEPKGNLMLSATNDDESGGETGLKYVLEKGIATLGWPMPNFHLLLAPSNWDVNIAYKGRIRTRIGVAGKSGHGGSPEKGTNAILKMIKLISRILNIKQASHSLAGKGSINLGTIVGGEQTNVIPDYCEATFDYRFAPPCNVATAVANIRREINCLKHEDSGFDPVKFEVFEARESLESAPDEEEIALLRKCVSDVRGIEPPFSGASSAGSAYWSLINGIKAVMAGPGDPLVTHSSSECITVDDLSEGARVVLLYIVRYLGTVG
jgi:acetylornithine deacetylase/succinyl-diaminopimelate desuccinylase family protein